MGEGLQTEGGSTIYTGSVNTMDISDALSNTNVKLPYCLENSMLFLYFLGFKLYELFEI